MITQHIRRIDKTLSYLSDLSDNHAEVARVLRGGTCSPSAILACLRLLPWEILRRERIGEANLHGH